MLCTRLIYAPVLRPLRTPRPGRPPRTPRSPCNDPPAPQGVKDNPWEPGVWPSPGRSLCRPRSPRRGPSPRRPSYLVAPRRYHPPGPDLRPRTADDHHGEHVNLLGPQGAEVREADLLPLAVGVPDDPDRGIGGAVLEQDLPRLPELPVPPLRARVVERDDEIGFGGRPHPLQDDLPGGKEVGEADRAVVVPERRAEQRGGGLRSRDPRYDGNVDVLPRELQRRGGHRVDARVPARDQRDAPAGARLGERLLRALDLAPERRRRDPGPRTQQVPHAVDVLLEPDDELRGGQRPAGEGWDQGVVPRPQAHEGEPAPYRQPPEGDGRHTGLPLLHHELSTAREHRRLSDARRPDGVPDDRRRVGDLNGG